MSTSQTPSSLLSTSLSSASSLVLLQLFSRLFTFALNQALVRISTPQTFGTASIQFELLLSTILFICREGVRNALLRAKTDTGPMTRKADTSSRAASEDLIVNISILPLFLGIPTAIFAALFYVYSSAPTTTSQPFFHVSVVIYSSAAVLELLAEPLYIKAQNQFRSDVRVRAEGMSIVTKTTVTFLILAFAPSNWALVAFAAGQAAYGMTILVCYLRFYRTHTRFLFKKVMVSSNSKYFDDELLYLSATMTAQSVVKHFLTEGDKFLVSRLSPLADQGGYALATNYGSLVARIFFQPIEETSRVFFSKTLSFSAGNFTDSLKIASQVLHALLLLSAHLFLLLFTFGPPYLPIVASILLPPRYHNTSAPLILRVYVYYIPIMALNGLLEAFFASTSTPADLRSQSRWMIVFSITYVVTAVGFARGLGWGDAGLAWANAANLGARAVYAWLFARRFFRQHGEKNMLDVRKCLPPPEVFGVFALSAIVTRWSGSIRDDHAVISQLEHIGLGACCVAASLLTCLIFEGTTFREMFAIIRRNK